MNVSNEQSPQIRDVVPYKSGKRNSTFRRLNLDFAGTALEQALAQQQALETAQAVSSENTDFAGTQSSHPPLSPTPPQGDRGGQRGTDPSEHQTSRVNSNRETLFADFSDNPQSEDSARSKIAVANDNYARATHPEDESRTNENELTSSPLSSVQTSSSLSQTSSSLSPTSADITSHAVKATSGQPKHATSASAAASAPLPSLPTQSSSLSNLRAAPNNVAPSRDYNRRANSLERDALPSGMFPGASKKVYDALYIRTIGHIEPRRTIRATKKEIMEWSGVSNRKTLDGHLRYLETRGLLQRSWELGDNSGYIYEVLLPEEVENGAARDIEISQQNAPPLSPSVPLSPSAQKRVRGTDQKRDRGGQRYPPLESTTYSFPKTIKTYSTDDDDETRATFAQFNRILADAVREMTGSEPSENDAEKFADIAREIVAELKRAATRAGSVSSPPAFLASHLRRCFAQKNLIEKDGAEGRETAQAKTTGAKLKRDEIGKTLPAAKDDLNKRLSKTELHERLKMFRELLHSTHTPEQLETQFKNSLHADDWKAINEKLYDAPKPKIETLLAAEKTDEKRKPKR